MKCGILTLSFALVLGSSAWSADEIADVKTLEDLRAVKAIAVGNGWEVQLGLSGGGADAGPWRLLYCLAKFTGPGEGDVPVRGDRGDSGRHELGPVCFDLEKIDREKPGGRALEKEVNGLKLARHAMYCQTIPVAWKGRHRLRVFGAGNAVLAERTWMVDADRRNYWRVFADPRRMNRLAREDEVNPPPQYGVSAQSYPAFPRFEALVPVVDFTRVQIQTARGTPLPGAVPGDWIWRVGAPARSLRVGEEDYGASLSIEKDVFVFRGAQKMHVRGDMHLMARWWVNGKPKPDKEGPLGELRRENGIVEFTREFRIALGLPAILGDLKPGDKVALQVMYSPAEYEEMVPPAPGRAKEALGSLDDWPEVALVPMCSNRVEFVVTQQMLDARGRTEE